jgi:hypothetical protein
MSLLERRKHFAETLQRMFSPIRVCPFCGHGYDENHLQTNKECLDKFTMALDALADLNSGTMVGHLQFKEKMRQILEEDET